MILKLLMLCIWMVLVPWGMGYFALGISGLKGAGWKIREGRQSPADIGYALCLGYMLMWALFQLIAVPYIMKGREFPDVSAAFEAVSAVFAAAGVILFFLPLKDGLWRAGISRGKALFSAVKSRENRLRLVLWAVFLAGLLFQLRQAYYLAYADGDDAFYIPLSVTATSGGRLYTKHPYTGGFVEPSMRYGLAPFPIWVAFIASKCRVNVAVAAHSLMPLVLIPLTYILYLEIGRCLCADLPFGGEKKGEKGTALPLFMIFVTLLQIFGNYSIYPASTFLLTRTRQGKAALGNVILPFFFLLLFKMAKEVKEQGKARTQNVLWLMAAMTAGCLCSTMSGFLCGMLVMLTASLIFILYRKPLILLQGLIGCLPGIAYALIYLKC